VGWRTDRNFTCYLDKDFRFDDIEADTWRRAGHEYAGRKLASTGEIVVKAVHDLEIAFQKLHPNASCRAVAAFWCSYQIQRHVTDFCARLAKSETAERLAGDSVAAAEQVGWAKVHIYRQLAAFAHETSDDAATTEGQAVKPEPTSGSDCGESDAVADERTELLKTYKTECRRRGIKITDEMIAKAASDSWHDRTPVARWKRNDPRCKRSDDLKIRMVLRNKPHLL
jgi:hypothetical protein